MHVFLDSHPSERVVGATASDSFIWVLIHKNKPLMFNTGYLFCYIYFTYFKKSGETSKSSSIIIAYFDSCRIK
jgi:hypothetical protein